MKVVNYSINTFYVLKMAISLRSLKLFLKKWEFKDPPAKAAPNQDQVALSVLVQPNHTINTINSNTYHLLEKVTKIHKRQVYNPKNE